MMKASIKIALAALLPLCGCNNSGEQVNIPRPTAYPRIAVADSIFDTIPGLALHFEANTSTRVDVKDSKSFDIIYPSYNATLYCSIIPTTATTRQEVLANREERMALNVGDNKAEIISLSAPSGFSSRIVTCRESAALPVQFIACDDSKWVVTGALFLNNGNTATSSDSIMPILEAVKRDVIHSMKTICTSTK